MATEKKTKETKTDEKKTKTEEKKTGLGYEIITDLEELQKIIKKSIDKGASNVEEVHQAIAKLPLTYIEKISRVKSLSKGAGDFQEKTIGNTYNLIRSINEKASDIALKILGKSRKFVK
jgi:hypothetical protein